MLQKTEQFAAAPPLHEATGRSRLTKRRTASRPQRIGLFGFFGIANFGNDGSLEAVLRELQAARPQAEFLCICGFPDRIDPGLSIAAAPINWRPSNRLLRRLDRLMLYLPGEFGSLLHAARQLWRMDALIVPGTGILDDYGTGPLGMPYWIFRWCALARMLGTKVVFINIGAGPIHNRTSRRLMKAAAEMADYRSYRDTISKDFMTSIGCDTSRDEVAPDVAFGLTEPADARPPRDEGEPLTVGVGIMSYNGWRGDRAADTSVYETYIAKMETFTRWLLAQGYRVRLLTGDASDQPAIERLTHTLAGTKAAKASGFVAEPASSLHDVMRQMIDTDVVVATRYHNVVCALKLGRPTLSISYAAKNDALLSSMGLGAYCQQIEQLDVARLQEQTSRLIAGRKRYERRLATANALFAAKLKNQREKLLQDYL